MLGKRGLSRHAVSVRLFARVFVTFVHFVKTNKHILNFFSPLGSHAHQSNFFRTKRYSNILTEPPPLTGASNARGVGRNRDSDPISGFVACCERCDGQLLSTRLSADTRLSIDACAVNQIEHDVKLTTDKHEASRGLYATAELLDWSKLTTCSRHLPSLLHSTLEVSRRCAI